MSSRELMPKLSVAGAAITRREAIRRAVVFSTGAGSAGRLGVLRADAPQKAFGNEGMHLLALGDWGMKANAGQVAVARQMGAFAKSLDKRLSAVLALGDNFHRTITPGRFESDF